MTDLSMFLDDEGNTLPRPETKSIKELYDVKFLIKSELNTVIMIDRYNTVYTFCRLYEEWCLKKKSEQIDDITKKERFDVTKDLPIKISTQR